MEKAIKGGVIVGVWDEPKKAKAEPKEEVKAEVAEEAPKKETKKK